MIGRKFYRSIEEFQREEIGKRKIGWSLEELYSEADINPKTREEDDSDPRELNFDF